MKLFFSISIMIIGSILMPTVFAQTQTFTAGQIPQTILQQPITNQCSATTKLAFYQGQSRYFYSTLTANSLSTTLRIFNTTTGEDGTFYAQGSPDSSKVFVYNPYGALSASSLFQGPNTFVSDFLFVSNIKPAGKQTVYVGYQKTPMYMLGTGTARKGIMGQIVHNIRRRLPKTVSNGSTMYSYLEYASNIPGGISGTINLNLTWDGGWHRTDNNEYRCNNIYIARCGDGIIDNPNKTGGNTIDGKEGILSNEGFAVWVNTGFTAETCDDGALNGQPGKCDSNCGGGGYCGDGIQQIQLDEQCDLGSGLNGSNECTTDCLIPPLDSPVDEAVIEG